FCKKKPPVKRGRMETYMAVVTDPCACLLPP
ncbi:MAG: hypothetical protein ACJAXT_001945, partial [Paracoccaceae bacterium]